MYRNILVALDGSECAQRALNEAIRIGASARVRVVFVVDGTATSSYPAQYRAAVCDEGRRVLEGAQARLSDARIECETELAETRNVTDSVVECLRRSTADMPADLVVMGTHGRSGLKRLALGSVAEAFVRRSTCPVLLTRAPTDES